MESPPGKPLVPPGPSACARPNPDRLAPMTWKVALPALVTLAAALVRCGSDPCTSADDVLARCAPTGEVSPDAGITPACEGVTLCKAQCTNRFSCSQIRGNDPAYATCVTQCYGR